MAGTIANLVFVAPAPEGIHVTRKRVGRRPVNNPASAFRSLSRPLPFIGAGSPSCEGWGVALQLLQLDGFDERGMGRFCCWSGNPDPCPYPIN